MRGCEGGESQRGHWQSEVADTRSIELLTVRFDDGLVEYDYQVPYSCAALSFYSPLGSPWRHAPWSLSHFGRSVHLADAEWPLQRQLPQLHQMWKSFDS